jgi:ADP-ribose pyrophosphatase YjhB (NUDIX family)
MKYCSQCGQPVEWKIPRGDNRERHVCVVCAEVHYQNPKIIAGCIVEWEDKVLLCRRAIEPRYGYWTLPAGFMENDETAGEAAVRETHEETNAQVDLLDLHTLLSLPHASQVYMMFRGRLREPRFNSTHESLDVKLFEESEIPWDKLAFPTIEQTLKFYYADRRKGSYSVHVGDIVRRDGIAEFHHRRV